MKSTKKTKIERKKHWFRDAYKATVNILEEKSEKLEKLVDVKIKFIGK